ncbi:MAG: GatB/YqeY domain-containing protein [Bacteroidales bacterium]
MTLAEKINEDLKKTMLAKDRRKLEALRAIKSALLLAKTGKDTSSGEIPEELELQLLQKLVKQRRESAEVYKQQNRNDLAEEELYQAEIIEAYLPAQMDEETLRSKIREIVDETGATGMKDMGKVMSRATKDLAGKADNKRISTIVKEVLGD